MELPQSRRARRPLFVNMVEAREEATKETHKESKELMLKLFRDHAEVDPPTDGCAASTALVKRQ